MADAALVVAALGDPLLPPFEGVDLLFLELFLLLHDDSQLVELLLDDFAGDEFVDDGFEIALFLQELQYHDCS